MTRVKIRMKEDEAKQVIKLLRQSKEILYHDNDLKRYIDSAIYRISQHLFLRKGILFPPQGFGGSNVNVIACLLYTSPSPRDRTRSRMPSSA